MKKSYRKFSGKGDFDDQETAIAPSNNESRGRFYGVGDYIFPDSIYQRRYNHSSGKTGYRNGCAGCSGLNSADSTWLLRQCLWSANYFSSKFYPAFVSGLLLK